MKVWIFTFLGFSALFGADEQRLALTLKAQADFNRVELSGAPQLQDASACIQTQAALLAVASPADLPLIHYRKGYCTLASAIVTGDSQQFTEAAAEFDRSIETWAGREAVVSKKLPAAPVSSGVRVLASVARLEAGADGAVRERARQEIESALGAPACPPSIMSAGSCESVSVLGRDWLGWMALEAGRIDEAARDFSGAPASAWSSWAAGRQALEQGRYADAVTGYRRAVRIWESARTDQPPSVLGRLDPPNDLAAAYDGLGGAQILAGDTSGAIASLTRAAQSNPDDSRALYLRARAREIAGQTESALSDYNLASRTAFAHAKDLASGEAHLYRGILLYRRKDFHRAEDEFASALNFEIPAELRADAVAWRHLAAVSSGSCDASRQYLGQSLAAVSPYFPREEARAAMASCTTALNAAGGGAK
jgi:tetratricopeptide (TPR) repeat protein